jgi:hypothetical protein
MLFKNLSLLLLLLVLANDAQITYKDTPEVAWEATTGQVLEGNGMFASPKYNVVVSLSADCALTGFDPATGDVIIPEYKPTGTCNGGVFFTDNYMAFIVNDATSDSRYVYSCGWLQFYYLLHSEVAENSLYSVCLSYFRTLASCV